MTTEPADLRDEVPPMRAFASHQRQFDRFLHLTRWFAIHMLLLLLALYCFIVAGATVAGSLFLALSLAALGYGIYSTPQVARDVEAAVSHDVDRS